MGRYAELCSISPVEKHHQDGTSIFFRSGKLMPHPPKPKNQQLKKTKKHPRTVHFEPCTILEKNGVNVILVLGKKKKKEFLRFTCSGASTPACNPATPPTLLHTRNTGLPTTSVAKSRNLLPLFGIIVRVETTGRGGAGQQEAGGRGRVGARGWSTHANQSIEDTPITR